MTGKIPDFTRWETEILKSFWYKFIVPDFQGLIKLHDTDRAEYERGKELAYDFFEKHLLEGNISLGTSGEDWDRERKPIDTAVIHHTSNPPGLRLSRLSGIELLRLYAPQYAKKEMPREIYSGHFRNDAQVFYPYHWFVRQDGTVEQLLTDEEIGWHAGNWDVNCRSIGICFDGDFEDSRPSDTELEAVVRLLRDHYPNISPENVVGHCEAQEVSKGKEKTTCPSTCFLSADNKKGWKDDLLAML